MFQFVQGPFRIGFPVGYEIEAAVGDEFAGEEVDEGALDETAVVVAFLGSWAGASPRCLPGRRIIGQHEDGEPFLIA